MSGPTGDQIILGVSFDFHNAAAAILKNGEIIAAAQEERFSRVKNDPKLPAAAIDFCLKEAGVSSCELDIVVFYETPLLKFDRILKTVLRRVPWDLKLIYGVLGDWFAKGKFSVRERLAEHLSVESSKIIFVEHHSSHAASAFFCSPFEEAVVITLDGVGEHDTGSVWLGRGGALDKVSASKFPNSLGLFYSAITAFLGFEVNEGEYKVMGMAPYGRPIYVDKFRALFSVDRRARLKLSQKLFNFTNPTQLPFNSRLVDWLGGARKPESDFVLGAPLSAGDESNSDHYADIAASAQACVEEIILEVIRRAMELTGQKNVCLAGGVALNSVANGRVQRELDCRLYVQPEAGDAGGALGAALSEYYSHQPRVSTSPLTSPYLGSQFSEEEVLRALKASHVSKYRKLDNEEKLIAHAATRLANGKVIGWMQGRAEWGPRALGNRSILADPRTRETQDRVNEKIKFRELFRPFAPSVIAENAIDYFEIDESLGEAAPEHFMLSVCNVREEKRGVLGATTHVDGSARVHVVEKSNNRLFHTLIKKFGDLTGVPVLLNTSFNRRGEPVVNAPEDALKTFMWSELDLLFIGNYVIERDDSDAFEF